MKTYTLLLISCFVAAWIPSVRTTGEKCNACRYGLDMVKTMISSEDMRGLVRVVVNETCMGIAGGNSERMLFCENIVYGTIDDIMNNLVPMFDVESLCSSSCPKSLSLRSDDGENPFIIKDSEAGCKACEDALKIVEQILTSNDTIKLIEIAVHQMCGAVSPSNAGTCAKIVNGIVSPIIKHAVTLFNPSTLCKQSGACSSKNVKSSGNFGLYQILKASVSESDGCVACKTGMHEIKTILGSEELLDLVHIGVHEMCGILKFFSSCEAIMNTAVDEAVAALLPMFDPETVCKQIGVCTAALTLEQEFGLGI